ncbi:efflux RND transporter periplasmic adaptor subunit [Pseudonocardia spinosispora]|uniref:efflux RND transporter periplasmic adaptor subunit n=1 Tax=Pseudonocardia spinosispora TaxID=103441 RepID=UPI00042280D9|nr:biotin/lipoyl-binding protein [Pseudonocardia spinosispora]
MYAAKQWPKAPTSRNTRRWLAAVSLVIPLALASTGCGSATPSPTAVRVAKGSVARTVSATGTLQAISEQKLGFAKGGKLISLMVSVGQQVSAGQVLARIDDFEASSDLSEAQAKLDREQARLDKLEDSIEADAAAEDADRADDVFGATKDETDTIGQANDDSLKQAQKQLDSDREALKKIREQAKADQDKCNRSVTGNSHRYDGYGDNADITTKDDKGLLVENPLDAMSPSCKRAERGKAAVASYQRRIDDDRRALTYGQRRSDIDDARQKVSEANARRDSSAAKNAAEEAERNRPHDLEEQEAVVDDAMVDVRRAQHELSDTTLIAPVAGTIASINGAVGEYLGNGSGGTTARAPGGLDSGAALPDTDSGVSSDSKSGGSDSDRPGGDAFMVLKNVNSFQVVVPFEESDATLVQPNQRVQVTFDAIPGLSRAGTVASITPTGTQIKDVNNYYASIVLNESDPRLKGGQTAETKVVVGGVDNVLVVPTAAIQRGGQSGVVQVLQPDGTTRKVQVQLGLVGDTTTQIVSGLAVGQQVVVAAES